MVPSGSSPDKAFGPEAAFACPSDRAIAAIGASVACREAVNGGRSALTRASYLDGARAKALARGDRPLSNQSGGILRRHRGGVSGRH